MKELEGHKKGKAADDERKGRRKRTSEKICRG
jgi:hypothetical protein